MRRPACIAVGVLVLLFAARAAAEPEASKGHRAFSVSNPFKVTLQSGTVHDMPPGLILPQATWNALDAEMKRLQTSETRLTAERDSLVASAQESEWGWGTIALIVGAFAAGTVAAKTVY